MHEHVYFVLREGKKVICFNDFQALVHQRRRIDRNFPPHGPVRVCAGLFRSDPFECVGARVQERSARSGKDQATYAGRTQVRIAFEIDDNDNNSDDHAGYNSGDHSDPSFHPPFVLATGPLGDLHLPFVMPPGVVSGTEIWLQAAIQDAVAYSGASLSNALLGLAP